MSRLYLVCAICERRQAEGLLSGAAWGRVELPPGTSVEHPAVRGTMLIACPTCSGGDPEWMKRAFAAVGINGASPQR